MTNEKMLRFKIDESGYKLVYIAKRIGVSYQTLLNKMRNNSDFTAPEIAKLCALLDIDEHERAVIFFAANVDK